MDEKKLEEAVEEAVDQGFNDDELQDIMNEIENLEKEFGGDESSKVDMAISEPKKTDLQDAIDQELQALANEPIPEPSPEPVAEESVMAVEENVVAMEPTMTPEPVPAPVISEGAHMDFSGSGQMDFNLNFNIGGHSAQLKVDGDKGFVVEMSGVYIHINEKDGCTVEMSGGVKFNVPFPGTDAAKKAA